MRGAWQKPLLKNCSAPPRENQPDSSTSIKHSLECTSSDEDSEEDAEHEESSLLQQDSVFRSYPSCSNDQVFQIGVSRINTLVLASKTGGTSCLICLEKIRITDPIWHCDHSCFVILHLICIQSWSRQALNISAQTSRLPSLNFPASWHCPKCRRDYSQEQIPSQSRCYCGKQADPPSDPWLVPHTCGERCERRLGSCDHTCMLLCHPGPCPPCPQLLELNCHCGKVTELRRCGQKSFFCKNVCGRLLGCGLHSCEELCHEGDCGACLKVGLHRCRCGDLQEVRPCSGADFQCDKICERELSCKKHSCGKRCHSGACGECQLQGRRTCPCGKEQYKELACDVKVPTCGSTCEKLLECGRHRCPERCHAGSCVGTCRILIAKACRCGGMKKEVPCYQNLVCERKCQSVRNCQRHACRRRCCDGDCPSCSEICGRRLRCGNHKCPAPCHRGLCAPCPLTVKIPCACGLTALEVPCGADKDMKPPKCSKACRVPQICGHGDQCKRHRCHFGQCPPCQLVCDKELSCGHLCHTRCHGPRPPAVPVKVSRKKRTVVVPSEGTPCPPCSELVLRHCMGNHPGGEKLVPCTDRFKFSCDKPCGNVLSCKNHVCQEACHEVTVRRASLDETVDDGEQEYDSCSRCQLKCAKKRIPHCQHPCEIGCHPGQCPPCRVKLKRSCHCETLTRTVECHSFNSLTAKEQLEWLSCKGPCHRKLENCSHMCSEICHPGPCPQVCHKKVVIRCSCQRLKEVVRCFEAQERQSACSTPSTLVGVLACDEECLKAKASIEDEQNHEQQKSFTEGHHVMKKRSKQRKIRGSNPVAAHGSSKVKETFESAMKWTLVVVFVLGVALTMYYGVLGLKGLSDWMNEIDSRKPKRKLP